jgi:quinoprotein glucose dehydrogenase
MRTGEHQWQVPNGPGPRTADPLKDLDLPELGSKVMTFPLLTKTLLFATTARDAWNPARLRVYDPTSGEVLHEIELPANAHATPMSYLHGREQYVVVAIGSGRDPDELIAFALPD